MFNVLLKILRWDILLKPSGIRPGWAGITASFISAQIINVLLPVRLGDISRVAVIGKDGTRPAYVFGSLLAEKYLDILAYAVMTGLLIVLMPLPIWIDEKASSFIYIAILASFLLLLLLIFRGRFFSALKGLGSRISGKVTSAVFQQLEASAESLTAIKKPADLARLTATTGLIWLTALLTNQIVFLALGMHLPVESALLMLVAVIAGLSLPSLPGKIGTFELAAILALGVFGVSQTGGMTYGIILHIIVYIPLLILGLISLISMQVLGLRSAAS
jgi:hypothetical protein